MKLFPEHGAWKRGNLHAHSMDSDGWMTQERVLRTFRDMRYDFICMTEHWLVTEPPDDLPNDLLFLHGVELNGGDSGVGDFHIIGIDLQDKTPFRRPDDIEILTPFD